MILVTEKCKNCGLCVKNCPVNALCLENKQLQVKNICVQCGVCIRVCPREGISRTDEKPENAVICSNCPVQCRIIPGATGACKRFLNVDGELRRTIEHVLEPKAGILPEEKIRRPIITAVGGGSNYPCSLPAPHIVRENRDGVDVITVVTEAPLSYSGVTVKLDTNTYIGEEGDKVYRDGKVIGMVTTEEYGSKMLSIGGANRLTSDGGFITARTIVELANGQEVEVSVDKKYKIIMQAGKAPIINGVQEKKMRIGCGSATVGLFAALMKECVDECIVIDHHVIGLVTEHLAGAAVGLNWSGVIPNAAKSSRGRYFGEHGGGIGGTTLMSCREAIKGVDRSVARPGIRILVVNTTGEIYALFELQPGYEIQEIPMTEQALRVPRAINETCEESRCSVMYIGGTGGSARGGVCKKPLAITQAVHSGKAVLTIGGAPVYILPGGGINFIVDTEQVVANGFSWVPTPATVAPVEYTMRLSDYEFIEGHVDQVKDAAILKQ
ncbi:MAG: 4Fe-4S binding protein [Treponema sp.]|jgi:NAD-dependent dihydropyrimidine dehydrogenase PreA subunit|nr:4Fe-4S binding protein [Treponema sp.]